MEETMIAGNTSSNELYNPLGNQFQSMGNSFQSRVIIIPDKIEATAASLVDFLCLSKALVSAFLAFRLCNLQLAEMSLLKIYFIRMSKPG